MTYNPNIPQATDRIADSQPVLLVNFQKLNTIYGTDHFAYDDGSTNATNHRKVTLPDQTATIPASPGLGKMVIFSLLEDAGTFTRPYYIRDAVANTVQYPLNPVKCFGEFAIGTGVLTTGSWGVTGPVTRISAGRYRLSFVDALADTNYFITASIQGTGNVPTVIYQNKMNATFEIQTIFGGALTDTNVSLVSFAVFRY